ncbi:MAG: SufD family Fe-S cluster assembly protein [Alphaproteobacteria bacterium]|jgi:Fe-S cluster assembly protein SufD|nr:SufD family Fe-S cluster assembly protein [Alphaproteobacteria bacterium]
MFNTNFSLDEIKGLPLLNFEAETVVVYNGVVQDRLSTMGFNGILNIDEKNYSGKPIHFIVVSDEEKDDYSIFMLNIFSNIKVKLITTYISLGKSTIKSKVALNISNGAELYHSHYFNLESEATLERIVDVNIQENAHYKTDAFLKNEGNFKCSFSVNIVGENSDFILKGFYSAIDKSETGIFAKINHLASNTFSDILLKGVVEDESQVFCDMSSSAGKDLKGLDINQYHKVMLLSDQARVKSKPGMQVFAEDVEANHGLTIADLDEKEIFFLKNRGIPYSDAEEMLKDAFANEIFNSVENEKLREELIKNIL